MTLVKTSLFLLACIAGVAHGATITEALAAADRPEADRERDARSQPAAVLSLFGLEEGQTVLDLFAGGGYYSEIAARTVGSKGTVYLHNNQAYLGFAGQALADRLANGRLPGVTRYDKEIDAIDLPDDSVDLVLMILTYHDLYYKTDGWDLDPQGFFAMVHRVLKPGGVLGIVDHVGTAGSGSSAAQDLHRIDPAFAREDLENAGFEFAGEIDVLKNDNDKLEVSVFDPSVRGKTSRFVYKYVEPR